MGPEEENMLSKIGFVFILLMTACFRLALFLNSPLTWWHAATAAVDPSRQTYYISLFIILGYHYLSTFGSLLDDLATYLIMATTSICLIGLEKLVAVIWFLWTSILGTSAWLQLVHSWYFDAAFHYKIHQHPLRILHRTRPRRAVRKLFPGRSRVHVLSIPLFMHGVPTFEQHQFASALRSQRWTTSLPVDGPVFDPSSFVKQFRLSFWEDPGLVAGFDEVNVILISLLYMTIYRFGRFAQVMAQFSLRVRGKWHRLISLMTHVYDQMTSRLYRFQPDPPRKIWIRM